MALSVGQVTADITGDPSGFNRAIDGVRRKGQQAASDVRQQFESLGQGLRSAGLAMTAAITVPVIGGMAKMVQESARLEGEMDKFNVVFGEASDQMQDWVNEFRKEVPLARSEIISAAASMQDLLVPMGIARGEAQGMSQDWLTLASRLSAFNNVPVDQALEAIRSGISGMARPLRQFGIDARQTALQQVALEEGIISAGEAMDEQARQQALLIQATRQSSDAIDGYEDQQGGLLFIQQEVTASAKDLAASYGEVLVPMVKNAAQSVISLFQTLESFDESTKRVIATVGGLAAAIGPASLGLGWAIKLAIPAVAGLRVGVTKLTAVMRANPILAVASAVAFVGTRAVIAHQELNTLKDAIQGVIDQGNDLDAVNERIAEIGELFAEAANVAETIPGVEPEDLVDPKIQAQLEQLIELQRELSLQKINTDIAQGDFEELDQFLNLIDFNIQNIGETAASIDLSIPFVEAKRAADEVVPALDMIEQGFQELTADEILADLGDVSVPDKMFPPGSLGALQENMQTLREQLLLATDPAIIERLKNQIGLTREQINQLTGNVNQTSSAMQQFGQIAGQALSQAVLHGNNLLDVLKNLAKQLASRALIQGLTALITGGSSLAAGSIGSAIFGGLFHSGGIVGGSGERMILAQGGEGVFTPGQMRAMGSLINSRPQATVSESMLQRSFEKALGNTVTEVSPSRVFELNQQGKRGY